MNTLFAAERTPRSFTNRTIDLFLTNSELSNEACFIAAVLPEQFYADQMPPAQIQGELALRRAVLEDALRCYYRQFTNKTRQALQAAKEAETWFFADDLEWPYSFVNICEVLHLEPTAIRRGLRRWQQQPEAVSYRRRQIVNRKRLLKLAA